MLKLFKKRMWLWHATLALICAIFPLSRSGPIMLKSYSYSPKERSQCPAEQI